METLLPFCAGNGHSRCDSATKCMRIASTLSIRTERNNRKIICLDRIATTSQIVVSNLARKRFKRAAETTQTNALKPHIL